jgi:hypothetical protein
LPEELVDHERQLELDRLTGTYLLIRAAVDLLGFPLGNERSSPG